MYPLQQLEEPVFGHRKLIKPLCMIFGPKQGDALWTFPFNFSYECAINTY
jgi:hypothetical protein